MSVCSFCGCQNTVLRASRLALCAACRDALCAVSPSDPRYIWFVSALRPRCGFHSASRVENGLVRADGRSKSFPFSE